jgi:hypothetical protein
METKHNIYELLGRISLGFTRIDFLISNIAYDLSITPSPYHFFGCGNFSTKIKALTNGINEKVSNEHLKKKFNEWIEDLDNFRKKRNRLVHAIILFNAKDQNELKLFNYRSKDEDLTTEVLDMKMNEIELLNKKCAEIHNEGFILRSLIEIDFLAKENKLKAEQSE